MKKFLFYFAYLIPFFRLALPYIAPVFIVFYFYSMSQDPSDDGFGSLMLFISFFVSVYYYINLFEKETSPFEDKNEFLGCFWWLCFLFIAGFLVFLTVIRFG